MEFMFCFSITASLITIITFSERFMNKLCCFNENNENNEYNKK